MSLADVRSEIGLSMEDRSQKKRSRFTQKIPFWSLGAYRASTRVNIRWYLILNNDLQRQNRVDDRPCQRQNRVAPLIVGSSGQWTSSGVSAEASGPSGFPISREIGRLRHPM